MDLFGKKAKKENLLLSQQLREAQKKLEALGYTEYAQVQEALKQSNQEISQNSGVIATQREQIEELNATVEKISKQLKTATNKLAKAKELYKALNIPLTTFFKVLLILRVAKYRRLN